MKKSIDELIKTYSYELVSSRMNYDTFKESFENELKRYGANEIKLYSIMQNMGECKGKIDILEGIINDLILINYDKTEWE